LRGIDNLELAIEDWYHKYPRDPWIAGFTHRLIRVYARAHDGRSRLCLHADRIARSVGR